MCIDYKTFNVVIFKNDYSLSKIQNCLNIIETAQSFNKIDFINKYWQINVIEKNRFKIAFNIKRKKYEFCVIIFDLINASITFQNIINDILRFFLNNFVVVYLNNILIYFKNDEKHFKHVKFIIKTLCKNNYYVKSSKYVFFQKIIKFCEHIVNNEKIRMNEIKLKIIRN